MRKVTVIVEEVPTNLVPAVAVKREGRALFVIIGRKGYAGGPMAVNPENPELNSGKGLKRVD